MELTKEQVQKNAISIVEAMQKTIDRLSEQLEDVETRLAFAIAENERLLEIIELGE